MSTSYFEDSMSLALIRTFAKAMMLVCNVLRVVQEIRVFSFEFCELVFVMTTSLASNLKESCQPEHSQFVEVGITRVDICTMIRQGLGLEPLFLICNFSHES